MAGAIKWFAKSSGTTSAKSKFIPVSSGIAQFVPLPCCERYSGNIHRQLSTTRMFSGKALTLGGSNKINQLSNKSIYGDLSAVLIWNAPFYIGFIRTPKQKNSPD